MKIVSRPSWWYSPDDEPDETEPCAHCRGEDEEGVCECPRCSCGSAVTDGEDHSRCYLIDEY
jgi:hypothetical protein